MGYNYVFLLAAYSSDQVRTYRSTNPARIATIANKYVREAFPVCIQAWVRTGKEYMIPCVYTACTTHELDKIMREIAKDVSSAESVMKGRLLENV